MKIALVGYGKTGQTVKRAIDEAEDMECVGIVGLGYFKDLTDMSGKPDVIIDFSHPSKLEMIRAYAKANRTALVIGTTGYGPDEVGVIRELAKKVPVVYTANFSLGISILLQILKQFAPALRESFDIELIEKHHRRKLDSPSGTAKMLLEAIGAGEGYQIVCGREGPGRRGEEIGVHSVRGGGIAGEHTVIFAGEDEILEITHRAGSNRIFAGGAILAARYAAGREPGLYDMNDVLFHHG